jgi:type I restriction enzyme S subunit
MAGEAALSGKYNAYQEYKDSGVAVLGLIPAHWMVKRLRYVSPNVTVGVVVNPSTYFEDDGPVPFLRGVDVGRDEIATKNVKRMSEVSNKINSKSILREGDLVSMRVGYPGVTAVVPRELDGANCASLLIIRKPDEITSRLLCYQINTDIGRNQIKLLQQGAAQEQINVSDIVNFWVVCPPENEATMVEHFLDHETAKIDTLIYKQQQLITLLKEKRQAVISHAVTKGLNPNAPMRDSGVEWLGEVPEHWSVSQVGHCAFVTKLTGFEYTKLWQINEDGAIVALRGFNVKERRLELNDVERISADLSATLARTKLAKDDIVFPCTGTIGNAAMIEENDRFHINQNIAKIRFDATVSSRFAIYWLTSSFTRTIIDRNNTSGMQPVVLIGDIRKLPIPRFDYLEQESVADYLDAIVDRFNILISNAESAITLMQERRTALISAAVTGKIDVRNWQAPVTSNNNKEVAV